ncbi:MAG TPA: CRTAC1 family protein [Gemmataceae bacterium]|nr:CRTAC1 family protein [Gemmataceae bacterium]
MKLKCTFWEWRGELALLLAVAVLFGVVASFSFAPRIWQSYFPSLVNPAILQIAKHETGFFREVAAESGVEFTYRNGEEAGQFAILESIGGGVALLDYDGDGLLDIFITGGGFFEGPGNQTISGYPNRLYKNLGNWVFQDVTHEVGLDKVCFYSHGVAVADYDCDGFPDLLITGWGRVALLHNVKDDNDPASRRFVDVTHEAGLDQGIAWATSAGWGDLDGDGFPDLYVCQYVNWSFQNNPRPFFPRQPDIPPPKMFDALPNKLYRNNRNGTFTDVSKEAGLLEPHPLKEGKALGVIIADLNGDGLPDIYVANDKMDNLLYLNRGGMKFQESAVLSGTAMDDNGHANGSKGIAAAAYDGSGRISLFVTNHQNEIHALYRNVGSNPWWPWEFPEHQFVFASRGAGISHIGMNYVGFGTGFLDFDLDGAEDIFIANGHVLRYPIEPAERLQRPVLLGNLWEPGMKPWEVRFEDRSKSGGSYFQIGQLGRGAAFGDLDNDGRVDIVVSHLNEPVAILRNQGKTFHRWLGVELVGKNHRDLVGAKLILKAGGRTLTRFITGGGSYLSSNDPRRIFGLGEDSQIDDLAVVWPPDPKTGQRLTQQWKSLEVNRYHRLVEGVAASE